MNRVEFIAQYLAFVKESGLQAKEVVASAGGALLMLGLRTESSDLDLDVPLPFYRRHRHPHNTRRSSLGEYVDYTPTISLQAIPTGIGTQEVDGVFIYDKRALMDQKRRLSMMPDRAPGKAVQDLQDIKALHAMK